MELVMAFVRHVRLKRSAEMLRTTQKSVGSIAKETGFASRSHFSQSFSAEFGATPGEFRRVPREPLVVSSPTRFSNPSADRQESGGTTDVPPSRPNSRVPAEQHHPTEPVMGGVGIVVSTSRCCRSAKERGPDRNSYRESGTTTQGRLERGPLRRIGGQIPIRTASPTE